MNYRHAFHAGNFADVMKHALLVRILLHLRRKDTPFRFIDTHAGVGLYDLASCEAERTGEWHEGFGRLAAPLPGPAEDLLRPYRDIVEAARTRHGPGAYPGSPAIARALLRPGDRALLVEKHPADFALLATRFEAARNVKVLAMDSWIALRSLIPPVERRGLVLVDPPYEEKGESRHAFERLAKAVRRWPSGTLALWYPIKDPMEAEKAISALIAAPEAPTLRLELLLEPASGSARLSGCGLVVVNPPWTLAAEAATLLPALADRLGRRHASFTVETHERPRSGAA